MKRKLVKHGEATMMVSLPAKWLKKLDLGKGDEIDIEEKGKNLLIGAEESQKGPREITITITKENKHDISPILSHAYRRGFNRIILTGEISDVSKNIRKITNNLLLGFEVTYSSKEKILVEAVSAIDETKYEAILTKIFAILRETHAIMHEDFKNNKLRDLAEIEEIRHQQDKFILFCRRKLINSSYEEKVMLEWEFLTFLMHIQHAYYYMYKYAYENKLKIEKPTLMLMEELDEYLENFCESYNKKDINLIHKINLLKHDLHFGKCIQLIEKSKGKNAVVYSYLKEIFRLIQI